MWLHFCFGAVFFYRNCLEKLKGAGTSSSSFSDCQIYSQAFFCSDHVTIFDALIRSLQVITKNADGTLCNQFDYVMITPFQLPF